MQYIKGDFELYILKDKLSYEAIGKLYNISGNAVKKIAIRLGIPLRARRKINPTESFNKGSKVKRFCEYCGKPLKDSAKKYCGPFCQNTLEQNDWVIRWKEGKETGISGQYNISNRLKRYFMEKYQCKCQLCGWGMKNVHTGTIPLEIHHIDGDYTNNQENNLLLLCPNCHSLTETYKSHNKEGRKARVKYT